METKQTTHNKKHTTKKATYKPRELTSKLSPEAQEKLLGLKMDLNGGKKQPFNNLNLSNKINETNNRRKQVRLLANDTIAKINKLKQNKNATQEQYDEVMNNGVLLPTKKQIKRIEDDSLRFWGYKDPKSIAKFTATNMWLAVERDNRNALFGDYENSFYHYEDESLADIEKTNVENLQDAVELYKSRQETADIALDIATNYPNVCGDLMAQVNFVNQNNDFTDTEKRALTYTLNLFAKPTETLNRSDKKYIADNMQNRILKSLDLKLNSNSLNLTDNKKELINSLKTFTEQKLAGIQNAEIMTAFRTKDIIDREYSVLNYLVLDEKEIPAEDYNLDKPVNLTNADEIQEFIGYIPEQVDDGIWQDPETLPPENSGYYDGKRTRENIAKFAKLAATVAGEIETKPESN